ncbi:hypothetical protein ASO14_2038 [Kurthia sp. 11kri321]|uniref:YjgB family protein n=1 Tax=Kurthia sp. 11kri321 TaxID=1750719 RepID=UPI000745D3C4|nr:YjgB family protein [Kurthia sp. 11kri321]AMA62889.1 hypothetical protein ASO14_2038 [Kurthia sp. 11kri321]
MKTYTKLASLLAASSLLLVACGEPEATPEKEVPKTQAAENTTAKTEDVQAEDVQTEDVQTEASKKEDTTVTSTSSKKIETKSKDTVKPILRDFLQNQFKTAKNGMTEGVPFESGKSVYEDITKKWGKPATTFSNNTNYIEYKKKGKVTYAFAIGRGDRVYDVRTFVAPDSSFKLSDITFSDIIAIGGKPSSTTYNGKDTILNYKVGKNTLKFVGPTKTKKLDHISIFNQRASEPMGGRG